MLAAPKPPRRIALGRWLCACACVVASTVLYFAVARDTYFFDDDAAHYLGLAESLLAGDGYRFEDRAHTRFPPGTSLAYLPVLACAGRDFEWIYRASAVWSIAALGACFLWLRARGERRAFALTLASGLSATWIEHSTGASLSEAPYAACCYAALWCYELAGRGSRAAAFAFALCAAASFYVRTAGAAWLAVALYMVRGAAEASLPARRTVVAVALTLAVAVGGWFVWSDGSRVLASSSDFGHESSYVGQWLAEDPHVPDLGRASLASLPVRAARKLAAESRHLAEILLHAPWLPRRVWAPWVVCALIAVASGLRAELRRGRAAAGVFFATSFAALLVWPYDEGRRFWMPLVPIALLFALRGVRASVADARRNTARFAAVALGVSTLGLGAGLIDRGVTSRPFGTLEHAALAAWLVVAAAAVLARGRALAGRAPVRRLRARHVLALWIAAYAVQGVPSVAAAVQRNRGLADTPRHAPIRAAADWLSAHARPDDVVLATAHAPLTFATGLRVRALPVTTDAERLREAVRREQPRFLVILDPRPNEYFRPTDAARRRALERVEPDAWREVHHADGFAILEARGNGSDRR